MNFIAHHFVLHECIPAWICVEQMSPGAVVVQAVEAIGCVCMPFLVVRIRLIPWILCLYGIEAHAKAHGGNA